MGSYEFLGDHAAHADAHDVDAPGIRPAHVVQQLDGVLGHLGCGISEQGLVALAHAPVVEDQTGVLVGICVAEIFGLALPGFLIRM
jgi:hypothetical protein